MLLFFVENTSESHSCCDETAQKDKASLSNYGKKKTPSPWRPTGSTERLHARGEDKGLFISPLWSASPSPLWSAWRITITMVSLIDNSLIHHHHGVLRAARSFSMRAKASFTITMVCFGQHGASPRTPSREGAVDQSVNLMKSTKPRGPPSPYYSCHDLISPCSPSPRNEVDRKACLVLGHNTA